MKKYLIFIDLDGTLLNDKKELDPKDIIYLNNLTNKGHKICLCTGRPYNLSIDYYNQFNNDNVFLACDNGTKILNPLKSNFLPILSLINKQDLLKLLKEINDDIYLLVTNTYQDTFGINLDLAPSWMFNKNYPSCFRKDLSYLNNHNTAITYINIWIKPEFNNHFKETIAKYKNLKYYSWDNFNNYNCYEITNINGDKSFSVKELSNYFQNEYLTISIGDDYNDLKMFTTSDISISMENSPENVKIKSQIVTKDDNNNHGAINILKTLIND